MTNLNSEVQADADADADADITTGIKLYPTVTPIHVFPLYISNSFPSVWYSNEYFVEIFCQCSFYLWEGECHRYLPTSLLPYQTVFTLHENFPAVTRTNLTDTFAALLAIPFIHSKTVWSSWRMVRWSPKPVHLFDSLLAPNVNIVHCAALPC